MSIFKVSTSKQANNIISVPDQAALLLSYDDYSFRYRIALNADPLAAVQTGGMIVRLYILNEDVSSSRKFTYFRGRDVEGIISNLRKFDGLIKDESKSTTKNRSIVLERVGEGSRPPEIDISSFISNEDISLLKRNILPKKSIRRIKTRAISKLDKNNLNLPVLSYNSNNPSIANGSAINNIVPATVKDQMLELLYEGKIDPASLWTLPSNTYVSAKKSFSGVKPRPTYVSRADVQNDPRKLNIIASQLSYNINLNMQTEASAQEYIESIEYEPATQIEISKIIGIPRSLIGRNNFVIRFEVRNTAGKIFQIAETTIQHGANIGKFMPVIPAEVSTVQEPKPGQVKFLINQKDPYAVGVFVYRRLINPNKPLANSEFNLISNVPTPYRGRKRSVIYIDSTATSINNYIYRFIPYTTDGVKSSLFTSVAVKIARGDVLPEEPIARFPNSGIITYNILNNGIKINLSRIPTNIVQIKYYRKNLSRKNRNFNLIAAEFVRTDTQQGYSIIDQSVNLNNIYEYQIKLLYKNGIEVTIPNTLKIDYNPVVASSAICRITNIRTTNEGIPDLKFDLEYQIQDNNIELIRKLMKEQNFLAEYQEDITINRSNIEAFLAYQVTRINLNNGDIESYDILPSNNFSDALYGPPKNVKPINQNGSYRYIITVFARPPDTVFKNLERTINYNLDSGDDESATASTASIVKPYTFRPYKWLNPLSLRLGTLISQDKHPESELAQGRVVDIKEFDITFDQQTLPSIQALVATKMGGSILLEWSVTGTLNKIDHFIIKNKVLGIQNILGAAHNISSTGNYKFKYILRQEEAGAVTFSIVPVYFDYTLGSEVSSNQVVI